MGEESRWGSPLGRLPEIEVLEDLLNHAALLDHCDDSKPAATLGTFQSVDFIHLAKQPCPAAPGELLSNVVYGPLLSGDLVFPDSINETNVFDNLSKSAISPQPAPA